MMVEENFWYWLAGLLEGEGSFLAPIPAVPRKPRLSISMSDEDVIARVANAFGLKYFVRKQRQSHHKIMYLSNMQGSTAIKIMRTIQPVMGIRRQQQIENAIVKSERDYEPITEIKMPLQNSIHELHWLAGILEGEGSFFPANNHNPNLPTVRLWMTDEDIVARVAHIWNLKYQSYQRNEKVKTAYIVLLSGKRAVELMQQLHPLMGIRRQGQIDKALASYDPDFYRKSHMKQCALQPNEVRRVRQLLKQGYKHKEIAAMFDVKWTVIADISCGRTWAWLED